MNWGWGRKIFHVPMVLILIVFNSITISGYFIPPVDSWEDPEAASGPHPLAFIPGFLCNLALLLFPFIDPPKGFLRHLTSISLIAGFLVNADRAIGARDYLFALLTFEPFVKHGIDFFSVWFYFILLIGILPNYYAVFYNIKFFILLNNIKVNIRIRR